MVLLGCSSRLDDMITDVGFMIAHISDLTSDMCIAHSTPRKTGHLYYNKSLRATRGVQTASEVSAHGMQVSKLQQSDLCNLLSRLCGRGDCRNDAGKLEYIVSPPSDTGSASRKRGLSANEWDTAASIDSLGDSDEDMADDVATDLRS